MQTISHREFWRIENEKNSFLAFEKIFSLGFGIETDIWDREGSLVISHNPAKSDCMKLEDLFQLYTNLPTRPKLAINIKSDGLQDELFR